MSHYKPYLAYKDSGVEWLGRVPEHWTLGPYKAMIQIENGSDYKEVEVNDGYPVIGSGGPFAFSSKLMYEGESVLLGRKGTIDKPLYVSGAFWAVDTMYWSIIKPGTHARFAYYIATTIPFDLYSTNTALPSMTKSVLGSHIVAFPGFVEQQSIAACGFHTIRPPSPRSSGQAFHGHLATCSTAIRPGSRSAATQGWHC